MDRSLMLSLSIAAALHAGLLFGFQRGPVPARAISKDGGCYFPPADLSDSIEVVDWSAHGTSTTASLMPLGMEAAKPDLGGFLVDLPAPSVIDPIENCCPLCRWTIDIPCGGEIVDSGRLDHPPKTQAMLPPAYPFEARSRGQSGEVVVEFVVDENGRVLDPHIISSTDRVFEEVTLRAVSKWRFEPGTKNGRAVRFHMALPVEFNLSDN